MLSTQPSLYQRLQTELAQIIAASVPGIKLPSEPLMAAKLGVSRATLREAMRTFEAQGLIVRRQGSGTYVVDKKLVLESGLEVLDSIDTLAKRIGLKTTLGQATFSEIPATEKISQILSVPIGSSLTTISRIIIAEGRPIAYLIDTLAPNIIAKEDLATNFKGSVLDVLLSRTSPRLDRSFTEIQAVAAEF